VVAPEDRGPAAQGALDDRAVSHDIADEAAQVRSLARSLTRLSDLDGLVDSLGGKRFVCLGEASHGTHEFYAWRAALSRRLIAEKGFTWVGVEGDWPDCWRINLWVRGQEHQDLTAEGLLAGFERWPTWMWANREVAEFLDWLRDLNLRRPEADRVGFYGLDVYSLWDSLRVAISWVEAHAPDALLTAMQAWQCFLPYGQDPQRYAWATRLVPQSCEDDVVGLLVEIRRRTLDRSLGDDEAFDALQNAEVAAGAEHYYRAMVRGDRTSWNVRDQHMADTIDRIAEHLGPRSQGLVWEHNTHIGDARATDMATAGLVTVGQLVRERHLADGVALVGLAAHHGYVLAAEDWGRPERVFPVPDARARSHEDLLHTALGRPCVLDFGADRSGPWLTARRGHRAIGVVYDPWHESGNYVPTVMGERYDALLWFENTLAVRPLHHEAPPREAELETEPSGF
jgi:erythromycin esterase